MDRALHEIDPSSSFDELKAADRRQLVIEHARPAFLAFFPVVSAVAVTEWITRPGHRSAIVIVGALYALIAGACLLLLRWRPQSAVGIAVAGVNVLCAAMLSYSPMVRGSGELCVLAIMVLLGGFAVTFPVGRRNQLLASIAPVVGYAAILQLGTTTAYPLWYSASALASFLFILAAGAHAMDRYRSRILEASFHQATLAAENARLRDEAEEANRAKTDLLSILSHELRTPVFNIRMLAEVIAQSDPSEQAEVAALMRRVTDQAKRASDLVQTMLEFGTIEHGILRVSAVKVEVAALLEDLRQSLPEVWSQPGVEIHWRPPDAKLVMWTDRGKLEAIVRNLLHNALRHTKSGSVSVAAALDEGRERVRFTVDDTGEGIAPQALPLIFERYSRSTSIGDGFGLGLYIVKRFSEVLGGEVRVESTPGVGTRFAVTIPLHAPGLAARPARAA